MNHPFEHARNNPDKAAYVMVPSREIVTYGQLAVRSARGARLLRSLGVSPGDHIAIFMENHARFFEIVWAAQCSGVIYTAISSHLMADEVAYIVSNCDARVLVTSAKLVDVAYAAVGHLREKPALLMVGGEAMGFSCWEKALDAQSSAPLPDSCAGVHMLYSSGTTGSPKGVYPVWAPSRPIDHIEPGMAALRDVFRISEDTVYLSPAPLYHAAPLIFNQLTMFQGGTSIIMEKFDAEAALEAIETWKVTTAQFVPIMFVRMLKLDPAVRNRYNLSSLKVAIHAAAPCPIEIKRDMINWWGRIIFEYYSSTENAGATLLSSDQWLEHPGSVGKPLGCVVHILSESGAELPPGEVGEVYFENPALNFEYYKEPEKTAATRNDRGWVSVGDIGYVDDEGFLYLSDRKNFMIISGGVNIYPQEIEGVMIHHPDIADVAIFGIPDPEFGQQVKAVVQLRPGVAASEELAAQLIAWCRTKMSSLKVPKSVSFDPALPRLDNGKLYKQKIAAAFQTGAPL
jgi:long-chain acyl-CoA synthetase